MKSGTLSMPWLCRYCRACSTVIMSDSWKKKAPFPGPETTKPPAGGLSSRTGHLAGNSFASSPSGSRAASASSPWRPSNSIFSSFRRALISSRRSLPSGIAGVRVPAWALACSRILAASALAAAMMPSAWALASSIMASTDARASARACLAASSTWAETSKVRLPFLSAPTSRTFGRSAAARVSSSSTWPLETPFQGLITSYLGMSFSLCQVGAVDHAGQTFVVLLHLDAHGAHDLEVVVDLRQRARQRHNAGSHADQRGDHVAAALVAQELVARQGEGLANRARRDEAHDRIEHGAGYHRVGTAAHGDHVGLGQVGVDFRGNPENIVGVHLVGTRSLAECAFGEEVDDLLRRGGGQVDVRAAGAGAQVDLDGVAVIAQTLSRVVLDLDVGGAVQGVGNDPLVELAELRSLRVQNQVDADGVHAGGMAPVDTVAGGEHRNGVAIGVVLGVIEGVRGLAVDAHRHIIGDVADHVVELGGLADRQHGLHLQEIVDDLHAGFLVAVLDDLGVDLGPELTTQAGERVAGQHFGGHGAAVVGDHRSVLVVPDVAVGLQLLVVAHQARMGGDCLLGEEHVSVLLLGRRGGDTADTEADADEVGFAGGDDCIVLAVPEDRVGIARRDGTLAAGAELDRRVLLVGAGRAQHGELATLFDVVAHGRMAGGNLIADVEPFVVSAVDDVEAANAGACLGEQVAAIDHGERAGQECRGGLAGFGLEQRLAVDVHATIARHGLLLRQVGDIGGESAFVGGSIGAQRSGFAALLEHFLERVAGQAVGDDLAKLGLDRFAHAVFLGALVGGQRIGQRLVIGDQAVDLVGQGLDDGVRQFLDGAGGVGADFLHDFGLFFGGQGHVALLLRLIRPSLTMGENVLDAVGHHGDPGLLPDNGLTRFVEDDLPCLDLVAVHLGHTAIAADHSLRVGEVGNPCVLVRAGGESLLCGAIETLLPLPIGLANQSAGIRLKRDSLVGVYHQADALLRSGRPYFVQQDRVVVHALDVGDPLRALDTLAFVRLDAIEECGNAGMDRGDVLPLLQRFDALQQFTAALRGLGELDVDPLLHVDPVA
nr:MAG TPA: hypothetical protein [Caudoviricetes sp.]